MIGSKPDVRAAFARYSAAGSVRNGCDHHAIPGWLDICRRSEERKRYTGRAFENADFRHPVFRAVRVKSERDETSYSLSGTAHLKCALEPILRGIS